MADLSREDVRGARAALVAAIAFWVDRQGQVAAPGKAKNKYRTQADKQQALPRVVSALMLAFRNAGDWMSSKLRRLFFTLLVGAACVVPVRAEQPSAPPPTADAIFDNYVRARGGEDALTHLTAIERIGWISSDTGEGGLAAGPYHTCIRYPDRIAIEIDTGVWHLAQALRADGAVECDRGYQACRAASKDAARELIDTARHANKDLLEKAAAWRVAPVTPSPDGTAWRLTLPDAAGNWAEFDRAGGHLRWLGRGKSARRFGDWRTVEGVTIPFRLEDYAIEGDERAWRNTVQLKEVLISAAPSSWCTERFGER